MRKEIAFTGTTGLRNRTRHAPPCIKDTVPQEDLCWRYQCRQWDLLSCCQFLDRHVSFSLLFHSLVDTIQNIFWKLLLLRFSKLKTWQTFVAAVDPFGGEADRKSYFVNLRAACLSASVSVSAAISWIDTNMGFCTFIKSSSSVLSC